MGAVNDIKVKVMPISRYNIFNSAFLVLIKMNDNTRLIAPRLAENNPLYISASIMVNKYKPALKYKAVFSSNMVKSDAMNFLFSLILLAILMAKNSKYNTEM